jgi:hypothetical protein
VADVDKFHKFARKVYLDNMGTRPFDNAILKPKQWAARLANTEILNLLDITHFGRAHDVDNFFK